MTKSGICSAKTVMRLAKPVSNCATRPYTWRLVSAYTKATAARRKSRNEKLDVRDNCRCCASSLDVCSRDCGCCCERCFALPRGICFCSNGKADCSGEEDELASVN